jgi:antagonist of KipI
VTVAFRVVKPGLLTTIQDLGRPHAVASGVTPGGAMDRFAHCVANLLVGNDRAAPALECTIIGPRLVAERRCLIAVTGGDLGLRIDGVDAPMWTSVAIAEGGEISFAGRRAGARAYVAVGGGIVADRWLGSASTDLLVGRGGMQGRPLREGDVVEAGAPGDPPPAGRELGEDLRPDYSDHRLFAIAGPHPMPELFGREFQVGVDSNRMGYRLDGPRLATSGDEMLSFAVVAGAVQVPSGGRPILLMADHQTAGGYPVAAVVAGASMPVAAQFAPGDDLVFVETSLHAALAMRTAQREALDSLSTWSM